MRPRINDDFGIMTFNEFNKFITDNNWMSHISHIVDKYIIEYTILYKYSKNKDLKVLVSRASKFIIRAYNRDREFNSIDELKKYISK